MTASEREAARSELAAAENALAAVVGLLTPEEQAHDSAHVRAHARYLWIVVGSRLKNYCAIVGIDRARGTLGAAIAMRHKLAYSDPDQIDDRTVRRATLVDAAVLAAAIEDASAALR